MKVEVVYATPAQQKQIRLDVSPGCTVQDAILQSHIIEYFPDIDLGLNKVGIWGKPVSLSYPVKEGDRIEVYRPLLLDPKQIRKLKANKSL